MSDATAPRGRDRPLSHEELSQLFQRTGVEPTVTTQQAAAMLGFRPQSLRRWACKGDGPIRPSHVNGRLRWSVAEIKAVLAGTSVAA